MDPQVQSEFSALREYLRQEFTELRKDITDLKVDAAVRKSERKAKRDRSRFTEGLIYASLPVAIAALIAAVTHVQF